MDHDVVTIRQEPELDPEELYRQHIVERVKDGLCLAVRNNQVHITVDNIKPLLKLLNINTCDEEVIDLIRNAFTDTGGEIKADDFEKVLLNRILTKDEEIENAIEDAYRIVDVDGDGVVTAADIYKLMLAIGEIISDDELMHMLKMVDSDGDGRITFEDFRKFILGMEDPETASEEHCEEQALTDNTEPPIPAICQPLPDHKKRRSLFTYGGMIAKQLSVVARMKELVDVSGQQKATDEGAKDNENGYDKTANESIEVAKTQDEKQKELGTEEINVKDGEGVAMRDVTIEKLSTEGEIQIARDNDFQVMDEIRKNMYSPPLRTTNTGVPTTEHSSRKREDMKGNEPHLDKNTPGITRINISVGGCSDDFMALIEKQSIPENDFNKGKEDNCTMSRTQGVSENEVEEQNVQPGEHSQNPVVSVQNECPPTRYSEKSPYYGRIRPKVFSMNPLPPLDNSETKRKESVSSISTESTATDPVCHSNIKAVVEMVDKQIQTSEEFDENIGEFGHATGVIMRTKADTESRFEDTSPDNMPLRRDSATITEVQGIPERLRKMKCLQKAILKRRNTSFDINRTQTKSTSSIAQLQRQSTSYGLFKHLTDRPRQVMSVAEIHPCHKVEKEETIMSPSPPKTGFRRFAEKFRTSTPSSDSLYDIGSSINSKNISIIDVSSDIIDESQYQPDVKRSEKHHGFKSIRPLSRVLMALRSNCNAKKVQSEDVTSISRFLEENGTPYAKTSPGTERKATPMKPKPLSRCNTLLNLELPIENTFRPKLKRTSTLTRIPVDTGTKHNAPVFLG
ncbi:uncharacterized protein [Haliotis asinina]|uniref:uncharacterized protein n=1 Tax=Haliotis asinina TaxID=109174 RepID=UPI0035327D54